jgi:uncharacterized protein involved in cysteine biosynthesis
MTPARDSTDREEWPFCSRCGYGAPTEPCPHCGDEPLEPTLRGRLAGPLAGVAPGLQALFRGADFLLTTRGTKRWLVPPLVLTTVLFLAVILWAWSGLRELLEGYLGGDIQLSAWDPGWLRSAAEWVLNNGLVVWLLRQASAVVFVLLSSMVAWYCFSIAYEAVAGPFLDEVQARIEARWFGCDPRSRLERPNAIPVRRCLRNSLLAGVAAVVLAAVLAWTVAWWVGLPALILPFLVAGRLDREYGEWLAWIARIEGRALWIGIEVSILCGILLVLFLPLQLVPLLGGPLYAVAAGACTAIALVDLPLERRGWPLRARVRFAGRHSPGLVAFGTVTGLLFAVPVLGPVVAVPCASVGALWLVCRLDKG